MNISSKGKYPANSLSNFSPHPFEIDGVQCASMEGFLQALKNKNPAIQKLRCSFVGIRAKKAGSRNKWFRKQKLYWKGEEFDRKSDEYQELLDRAYDALYENEGFKDALRAAGDAVFTHSIGKKNQAETVLTTSEFCSRITKLRDRLKEEDKEKKKNGDSK
jgi:predicted NAD-dependent protein-ADP-ribosyltransferase YbiA (DUF1768 family)